MTTESTSKRILVTITKEIEVTIRNDMLTPESLAEFSQSFYETGEPEEMFKMAAQQIARFEPNFIEGLGSCVPIYSHTEAVVRYNVLSEEVETE